MDDGESDMVKRRKSKLFASFKNSFTRWGPGVIPKNITYVYLSYILVKENDNSINLCIRSKYLSPYMHQKIRHLSPLS